MQIKYLFETDGEIETPPIDRVYRLLDYIFYITPANGYKAKGIQQER
jgi:hypothetical protein